MGKLFLLTENLAESLNDHFSGIVENLSKKTFSI